METYMKSCHYELEINDLHYYIKLKNAKESPIFPDSKPNNVTGTNNYQWKIIFQPIVKPNEFCIECCLFKLVNVVNSRDIRPAEDVWVKYSLSIICKKRKVEIGGIMDEIYKLDVQQPHSKSVKLPLSISRFDEVCYDCGFQVCVLSINDGIILRIKVDTLTFQLKELAPEDRNFHDTQLSKVLCSHLDNPAYSDIKICVGDIEIKAHKLILSAISVVFAAMLDHDFVEKNSGRIVISDFDVGVVRTFLRYIYGGYVDVPNFEMAENLLKISDKYAVEGLKQLSSNYLARSMTTSNCISLLSLAKTYRAHTLKKRAVDYFLFHSQTIVTSASFATIEEINPSLLSELLVELAFNRPQESIAREQLLNKK